MAVFYMEKLEIVQIACEVHELFSMVLCNLTWAKMGQCVSTANTLRHYVNYLIDYAIHAIIRYVFIGLAV